MSNLLLSFLGLIGLYVFYLVYKYCLKPYLRMQKYKGYKGATLMPFVPVAGAFAIAK